MSDQTAMIEFKCESCGHQYRVKAEMGGHKVRCKCGQVMVVPGGSGGATPPPPPTAAAAGSGEPIITKAPAKPDGAQTEEDELAAIEIDFDPWAENQESGGEIKAIGAGARSRHEDKWNRKPNTTGQGAIHVKTFSGKTNEQSLEYLDQKINEWLDAHPEYEVKFATAVPGEIIGKTKEPGIFISVWV